jgi:hypothetical protein
MAAVAWATRTGTDYDEKRNRRLSIGADVAGGLNRKQLIQ